MNLSATQDDSSRETILLTEIYYSVESGYGQYTMPILHCCGRSESGERRHVRVTHFRPRFYCSEQEFVEKRGLIEKQMSKRSGSVIDVGMNHRLMDGRKTLDGVMIVCETPDDVDDLAENFSRTWEVDVDYTEVFKTDKDITTGLSVPRGSQEVHHSQVESEDTDVEERVCTFDIEVRSDEGFPDDQSPTQEVTAITAHDSYTDEYWSGILRCQRWGKDSENHLAEYDNPLTVYESDKELLYSFVQWLTDTQFDILTGWNSSGFDIPYFVNRCLKLNVGGIEDLSPTNDVRWISGGVNYAVKGLLCLDALDMYKAVTIGQEKSYKLENIASVVLGEGKVSLENDIDDAWESDPLTFIEYNRRDVEAVVNIIAEKDMITDFRGRRELTGTQLDAADYPKNLIEESFLNHSRDYLEGQT